MKKSSIKLWTAALLVFALTCGAALSFFLNLVYDAAGNAQAAGDPEQEVTYVGGRHPPSNAQGSSLFRARDRLRSRFPGAILNPLAK